MGWAAASSPYCSGTMAPTPTGWAGAILTMNCLVWLMDRAGMPRRFGVERFTAVREGLPRRRGEPV